MSPTRFMGHVVAIGVMAAFALVGAPAAQAAQNTSAVCAEQVVFYGDVGYKICGTGTWRHGWPNGSVHFFVIGLDDAVWHNERYPGGTISGWHSLDGRLQNYVIWWYYDEFDAYRLGIRGIGMDNKLWCKTLTHNGWLDWIRCPPE